MSTDPRDPPSIARHFPQGEEKPIGRVEFGPAVSHTSDVVRRVVLATSDELAALLARVEALEAWKHGAHGYLEIVDKRQRLLFAWLNEVSELLAPESGAMAEGRRALYEAAQACAEEMRGEGGVHHGPRCRFCDHYLAVKANGACLSCQGLADAEEQQR